MDILEIKGLTLKAVIGAYEWEKQIRQTIKFDIEIRTDFSDCQDKLERCIDYAELSHSLEQFVSEHPCQLIETLAHQSADFLMEKYQFHSLKLGLSKPKALTMAENVKVIVERS